MGHAGYITRRSWLGSVGVIDVGVSIQGHGQNLWYKDLTFVPRQIERCQVHLVCYVFKVDDVTLGNQL